jgi:hypothetical protein
VKTGLSIALICISLVLGFSAGFISSKLVSSSLNPGDPASSIPKIISLGQEIGGLQVSAMTKYISNKCITVFLKGNGLAAVNICPKDMTYSDTEDFSQIFPLYTGRVYDYSISTIGELQLIGELNILSSLISFIEG